MVCCEDFEKVGAETRPLEPKKIFHFFAFFVSFSLSPTCLCISWCFFVGFSFILGQYISCGMSMGHISVFALLCFAVLGVFRRFCCFCAFFRFHWQFGCFEGNSKL